VNIQVRAAIHGLAVTLGVEVLVEVSGLDGIINAQRGGRGLCKMSAYTVSVTPPPQIELELPTLGSRVAELGHLLLQTSLLALLGCTLGVVLLDRLLLDLELEQSFLGLQGFLLCVMHVGDHQSARVPNNIRIACIYVSRTKTLFVLAALLALLLGLLCAKQATPPSMRQAPLVECHDLQTHRD